MATILLTSSNPGFADSIDHILPGVTVLSIGPNLPEHLPKGPVWCFVDWLLPDTSGLEVCRRLRAWPATRNAHVTLVLDADDEMAKRRALGAGADDYMQGPLSVERLGSRLRKQTAEQPIARQAAARLGNSSLTLDAESHQVRWNGKLVVLRPREISLLSVFLENPDRLLSRSRLIGLAGDACAIRDERTVDVWVGRLRRSLAAQGVPDLIRTVRSHGYVMDTPHLPK